MTNRTIPSLVLITALSPIATAGCGSTSNEFDAPEFEQIESELSKSCAPKVDPSIQVPDGNKLAFSLEAYGYQVYVCQASGTGYAWALQAPDAALYNAKGKAVGTHYAGPTWEYKDASTVVGAKVAAFTPDASAIPWLLVQATAHGGAGKMADVTYIQRLDTVGGLAPEAATCTADTLGGLAPVEYSAVYHFFASGNTPCGCK